MTTKELESRVVQLETKVAEMQTQLESISAANHPNPKGPWWTRTAGRFKDDPVFEEIVRLGREYRESTHPDYPKRKKTKRKK